MTKFAALLTALAAVVAATFVLTGPAQSQAEPKPAFHPTKIVTIVVRLNATTPLAMIRTVRQRPLQLGLIPKAALADSRGILESRA